MKTLWRKFLTSGPVIWILLALFMGATFLLLPLLVPSMGVSSWIVLSLIWILGWIVLIAGAEAVEKEKSIKGLFKDIGESLVGLSTLYAASIFIFSFLLVVVFPFLAVVGIIDEFHAGLREGKPFLIVELSNHWWAWTLGMGLWAIGVVFVIHWLKRLKNKKS